MAWIAFTVCWILNAISLCTIEKRENRLKFRQVKRIPSFYPYRVGHMSNKHKVETQVNIPVETALTYEMQWSLKSIWVICYTNKLRDFKHYVQVNLYHSLQRINILISGPWKQERKGNWGLVFLSHFPATVTSLEWLREIQKIYTLGPKTSLPPLLLFSARDFLSVCAKLYRMSWFIE